MNPYSKENPGNFANDRERASEAGKKGGEVSPGKFKEGSERAREAGHKGGTTTAERYLDQGGNQ